MGKINKKLLFVYILIALTAFLFSSFHLKERYSFDWDQEDDAVKVTNMIESKRPTLIGPRVVSESGFFVGPYHYYFLTPFYFLTSGHPVAGAYAVIFVNVITAISYFFVASKLFGVRTGLIAGILTGATVSLTSWNVMYTSIISIFAFYFCIKLLRGELKYFLPLAALSGFAATIHLVPLSIALITLITLLIAKKRPSPNLIFKGLFIFLAFFIPLIIFDLRHDGLIVKNVIEFLTSKGESAYPRWLFLRSFWRSLDIFYFPTHYLVRIIEGIVILCIVIINIFKMKLKNEKLLLTLWFLLPLMTLSIYRGNIPEYYYGVALAILPILVANLLSKINYLVGGVILLTIVAFRLNHIRSYKPFVSLNDKEQIVLYMLNQNRDERFFLSYNLPAGMHNGFGYLFKHYENIPVAIPEAHLYTVVPLPVTEKGELVFKTNTLGIIRK